MFYIEECFNLKILEYPDRRLRLKCTEVKKIDASVRKKANNIFLALKLVDNPFMFINGLAANQIGLKERIVIIKMWGNRFITMINPKIISSCGPFWSIELCASLPKVIKLKKRNLIIKVEYLDLDKKLNHITLFGSVSSMMQHEIDHLNGELIID